MKWQSIETAPRDGRDILLTDGDNVQQASWWVNEWMIHIGESSHSHVTWNFVCEPPTHWMPLPEPPSETAEEAVL